MNTENLMQIMLTARQHDIDDLIEKLWRARIWMRQNPAAHAKNICLSRAFKARIKERANGRTKTGNS